MHHSAAVAVISDAAAVINAVAFPIRATRTGWLRRIDDIISQHINFLIYRSRGHVNYTSANSCRYKHYRVVLVIGGRHATHR